MKTKMQIVELSHDDIVTILSDAFYGGMDFALDYHKEDYDAIPEDKRSKGDEYGLSYEDKCADILLNGGAIYITDMICEGEVYGKLEHKKVDEGEEYSAIEYKVTLQDFINGLQCEDAVPFINDFIAENDDYYTGYNLIQCILFGELIYG